MEKYGYGVDFGGTALKLGRFDTEGTLLKRWEIPTDRSDSGSHIMPDIAAEVLQDMKENGLGREAVLGIGVTVPGPINRKGTTMVNLGGRNRKPDRILEECSGLHCVCGNDANCAALGEYWKGTGRGYDSILLVTLGTGVGSGIVIDGKILNGYHGGGGEIGHIPVSFEETEVDACGNYGCVQQYASATGMVRLAKKTMRETVMPSALRQEETITAKLLWEQAEAGDPLACKVADKACDYLARGLAMAAGTVNTEAILIGGGVSRAGEPLRERVERFFRKRAFSAVAETKIRLAGLGNDAGMYGAVRLLLDSVQPEK